MFYLFKNFSKETWSHCIGKRLTFGIRCRGKQVSKKMFYLFLKNFSKETWSHCIDKRLTLWNQVPKETGIKENLIKK